VELGGKKQFTALIFLFFLSFQATDGDGESSE
jgi:hypothetical protein